MLGEHRYEIRPEGLFEKAPSANEHQLSLDGPAFFQSLEVIVSSLFGSTAISSTSFRVAALTKRKTYDQFFAELQSKWRAEAA